MCASKWIWMPLSGLAVLFLIVGASVADDHEQELQQLRNKVEATQHEAAELRRQGKTEEAQQLVRQARELQEAAEAMAARLRGAEEGRESYSQRIMARINPERLAQAEQQINQVEKKIHELRERGQAEAAERLVPQLKRMIAALEQHRDQSAEGVDRERRQMAEREQRERSAGERERLQRKRDERARARRRNA